MTGFDWGGLMRAGIGHKGLLPHEFWALTPAELMMVLGLDGGGSPAMARTRLEELSRQWPDAQPQKETENGSD